MLSDKSRVCKKIKEIRFSMAIETPLGSVEREILETDTH